MTGDVVEISKQRTMHVDVSCLKGDDVLMPYAERCTLPQQQADVALIRDDLRESALASPRNRARSEGADLVEQAACPGRAIVRHHAFVDGNTRIALAVVQIFLACNGHTLTHSADDPAAWVIALTPGTSAETFAACIRSFVTPLA